VTPRPALELRPFPGVRYRVPPAELPRVLAPPYDVITPDQQAALEARDPRNVVRVVLNHTPGDAGYDEAGATYRRWLAEGVLAPDPAPALYLLEQEFAWEGRSHRRIGLLARFRAVDPAAGVVLPHEHTRPAAREDRYRVLLATRANFSPIFLMFPDDGRFAAAAGRPTAQAPELEYTDDGGVVHRMWRVAAAADIDALTGTLASVRAYIADGHHRYATALRYRDAVGPEGAWTFGYFTPLFAPGLLVLPYHRVASQGPDLAQARERLAGPFELSPAASAAEAAQAVARSRAPYAFALAAPGGSGLVVAARPEARALLTRGPDCLRALDTFFLHQAVLPRLGVPEDAVRYVHSLAEAETAVAHGACRLAILLRGTPVRQIVDVAEAGEAMPPKSTFFHPKLPSGLVIHPLVA
jgi:uncharacterized protein (DUF1015 family)